MRELDRIIQVIDHAEHAFAVYRFIDHKVKTLCISDGMYAMDHAPDEADKQAMINRFDNNMYKYAHPDDTLRIVMAAKEFAVKGGTYHVVYREKLFQKDTYSLLQAVGYHHILDDGSRIAVVNYTNITEGMQANIRSEIGADQTLRSFLDHTDLAMAVVQRDSGELLYCNAPMRILLKPVNTFDMGMSFSAFLTGREDPAVLEEIRNLSGRGNRILTLKHTGENVMLRVTSRDWEGQEVYYIESEPWNDLFADELTGLMNLTYFRQKGPEMLKKIRRMGQKPAFLYFKLYGLRGCNMKYGMQAGDELLRMAGQLLQKSFSDGIVCRSSGGHFMAVIGSENLQERIEHISHSFRTGGNALLVQLKTGVYIGGDNDEINEETTAVGCDCARLALNTVKNDVRRPYAYYDSSVYSYYQNLTYVLENFRRALDEHWLKVYYQPICSVKENRIAAFESLCRWEDPEKGMLSPGQFIPLLEQHHLVGLLDQYMAEEVCREWPERKAKGYGDIPVSFNISRDDFSYGNVSAEVSAIAEKYHISHDLLIIEVTESAFSDNSGVIEEQVRQFHEAGFKVWMDDFGSAYSSLGSLQNTEVDLLKLDIRFLQALEEDRKKGGGRAAVLLQSVIRMAENLKLNTLCEGVETEEQLEVLRKDGCDLAQGFCLGRPAPIRAWK